MDTPESGALESADDPGHRRRLARSTAVFSAATAVSRVLGLVREMVSAYFFGVTGLINAFTVAIQIPNLVRSLLADAALSGAFVPVFSELLEKGEKQRAWRVASTLFWLTLLVLGGLTAVFILLAPLLMKPFGEPGGDYHAGGAAVAHPLPDRRSARPLRDRRGDPEHVPPVRPAGARARRVEPRDRRRPPSRRPRIESQSSQLYLYAGLVVLGTLVQLLLPFPWLRKLDGRLSVALDWRDPAVRAVLTLMLPVTLTIGLINVNVLVDTLFASRLLDPDLAPAAINAAFRLYMLPQGIFSVAVATVLFPTLARLSARGDTRRPPADARRRHPSDRVPAPPFGARLDRARRADRPPRLPARAVHRRGHDRGGPVPAGVLDRARLQRLGADPQPHVLRRADELDADRGRRGRRGSERRLRRGLLSPRSVGDPARDVDGERARRGGSRRPPPSPDRPRHSARRRGRSCASRLRASLLPASRSEPGTAWTRSSGTVR